MNTKLLAAAGLLVAGFATGRATSPAVVVAAAPQPQPRIFELRTYTAIDGKLTQTENVADLAGLAAAFDAYRESLGARAADRSYVRQRDREFFIAFAQAWRTKTNESALRAQLASDHAPEMYRIATVRNRDAWYEAFDVRPGQRLYLAPEARVRIW